MTKRRKPLRLTPGESAIAELGGLRRWAKIPSILDDTTNEGCELWARVCGDFHNAIPDVKVLISHREGAASFCCVVCADEIPDLIHFLERVYALERALPRGQEEES